MSTEQQDVSPASAGGAPAPAIKAFDDAFTKALSGVAEAWKQIVAAHPGLAYLAEPVAAEILPADRKPTYGEPGVDMDWDEDDDAMAVHGIGWSLSWGCKLSIARDCDTGEHYVCVNTSGEDQRKGIVSRSTTREQIVSFAQQLLNVFGEPAGPDPRDAEIERLRKEYDEAVVSGPLRETLDAEIERLTRDLRACEIMRNDAGSQRDRARRERDNVTRARDEWREQWKRADVEIERLRAELYQIRNIALVVLNVLPDDDDRSAVDLVREILESAGPEKLQRDNQLRGVVAERDRKRRELADVTAERDRLRKELALIGEQQPKFQPGQRVRIGLCDGIVITPKDTTRVQFEGMLHTFDIPTRDVHAIDDIVPAEPRRWVAGDPEPEIGTTVWRRADKYTRSGNGWRRVDIHTGYASWAWILSVGSEIVEAIADPKDGA